MAIKNGLGRGISAIEADARKGGEQFHPLLSAVAFAHLTETQGGATMDANTGEALDASDPSQDTYVVGGEPDTKGKPIRTIKARKSDLLTKISKARKNVVEKTGGRENATLGSWTVKGVTDLDASGKEPDLEKAMQKMDERKEKAIFSSKKFRESGYEDGDINNPKFQDGKWLEQ